MDLFTTIAVAVGLAMDAFAVSLGSGASGTARTFRPIFRLAFHFGLFQALMTLLGWFGGSLIAPLISSFDHWIILVLLAWVGIRMIQSGLDPTGEKHIGDPSKGGLLVTLCFATSLDALAVGISLAMIDVDIFFSCGVIGIITLLLSTAGALLGNRLGQRFGKKMEIVGGIILILIGLRVVIEHLF
jgi:putative Mn2+ efflux pump MntP